MLRGEIPEGKVHLDQGIAFYDPVVHRPLAARFGEEEGGKFVLAVMDAVDAWLPRWCACGR